MGAIKALRALLGVLLCALLALSLWLTAQRQVFHQEELAVGGLILAPVEGDAMSPALRDGDMAVAVSRSGYEPPYSLGDPVLCVDGTLTRLVGAVDGDFIARGDGQGEEAEALLSPGDIRGKVAALVPGAAGVYGFLSSWWGPPAVLAAGALLLSLPALLGLGRDPDAPPKRGRHRGRHARRD